MEIKTPWKKFYDGIDTHINYPHTSLYGAVKEYAHKNPDAVALRYMGRKISYCELIKKSRRFGKIFRDMGVCQGDRVAVCLPNIPEAVYCLYGLNSIGAVAGFLHPLSAESELDYYIKELEAKVVVTLDSLFEKFSSTLRGGDTKFLLANGGDSLPLLKKFFLDISQKKIKYSGENIQYLSSFRTAEDFWEDVHKDENSAAVVLFSGGTTGVPKGVMISDFSLNAMALQTGRMSGTSVEGKSMLAAMPMFHGFGLAVCIHTMLISGGCSILVPRFTAREYAKLIIKSKPAFIAGVPTLFEAILRCDILKKADLSCLWGVFSGGDTLPVDLKNRFDVFLESHGAKIQIREGYGATECVTASCLTPVSHSKVGSIGIPFPDVFYKICKVDSFEEEPYGVPGEICISGNTLMMGYLSHKEETDKVLKTHPDGRIWLHTGDLGYMDEDGFVYFKQRLKRIIVVSGYNVYPSQIERIMETHESIYKCCAVSKNDRYKMHKLKLYAVLNSGFTPDKSLRDRLTEYAKKHIARYAIPGEIEFVDSLPVTKYGKVDFMKLQEKANKETE